MKHKIKIISQQEGYVGYVMVNDEVVFNTALHNTSSGASEEIARYINNSDQTPSAPSIRRSSVTTSTLVTPNPSFNKNQITRQSQPTPISSPRKCCGRG